MNLNIREEINHIDVFKLKLVLRPLENIYLPKYKWSIFRGAFGMALRRLCCVNKKLQCDDCYLTEQCPYFNIFESSRIKRFNGQIKHIQIPRGFVIEPPDEKTMLYDKYTKLNFNLIIIGKLRDYLPYFVLTFQKLGELGIGRKRGKYFLEKIFNSNEEVVYDGERDAFYFENMRKLDLFRNFNQKENKYYKGIKINFISPTRIKIKKKLLNKPNFENMINSIIHRVSGISYYYCEKKLNLKNFFLTEKVNEVKTIYRNIRWLDWERFSRRQKRKMKLGGFVGSIIFEGDLSSFLPLLVIGEAIHIGKNTTFGLGKYKIEKEG